MSFCVSSKNIIKIVILVLDNHQIGAIISP
nr:MAG TPA: hypothetical protein [Caudoviricetes sp.]